MNFPILTVGWKAQFDGKEYGNYTIVEADEVSHQALNDAVNQIVANFLDSTKEIDKPLAGYPKILIKQHLTDIDFNPLEQELPQEPDHPRIKIAR